MEREQAVRLTQNLLRKMVEREGSDLFHHGGLPTGDQGRWHDPQSHR